LADLDFRADMPGGIRDADGPNATRKRASTFPDFRTRNGPAVALTSGGHRVR